ncbi:MAG: patatin-like phospholipase family protein [Proteobacteria bacterium]|nr:patatin-like phospholipase family protein [Pseudomonadota bacterium]
MAYNRAMDGNRQTVSLVLGSGGARGLAHIGIIRVLEEKGYQIKAISGCSVGALVGGIYAAGKLAEYEDWVRKLRRFDMVNLLDIAWVGGGLVKGDKIIKTMRQLVGERLIEELPIPFTAVATELESGREVWLNEGPLFDAIRSSCSLPIFFTPFRFGKKMLVDGGVVNPVPMAPVFNEQTDVTIAVNLGGKPDREATRDGDGAIGATEVAYLAFDAMQSTIARQKLAAYPPDLTIEIPRDAAKTFEIDRASELIELGRAMAEASLPERRTMSDRDRAP